MNTGPTRQNILGVEVSAISMADALAAVGVWVKRREPNYVCVTPAHGVMDARRDPDLLRIFNGSGMTTPDGMSVVWILKLLGYRNVSRVYGPDLMLHVCASGLAHSWRHFFYGGATGVPEALAERLTKRFPGLRVAGSYAPPFRPLTPQEDADVIRSIDSSRADIVWVGLSTPKQEIWMAQHVGKVQAPVLVGVGAAFDFLSGTKRQAPQWMQRSGLEWLFRLSCEPARLWRRYIAYPWFVLLVIAQLLRALAGGRRPDTSSP